MVIETNGVVQQNADWLDIIYLVNEQNTNYVYVDGRLFERMDDECDVTDTATVTEYDWNYDVFTDPDYVAFYEEETQNITVFRA